MKIILSLWLAGLALACPAFAHTLLIVSDSGGMFGTEAASLAMEKYAAEMVRGHLGRQYRTVYTLYGESKTSAERFLRAIVSAQRPGERLDIFAMRHTGRSIVSGVEQTKIEEFVPKGLIRNFYSSGCSDWGDFNLSEDGKDFEFKRDDISGHLERLGIEEYVVHANFNATMPVLLPLVLPELRKSGSWIEAASRAYDHMERIAIRVTPEILMIQGPMERLLGTSDLPFLSGGLTEGIYDFFESRPVLGGTALGSMRWKFRDRSYLSDTDPEVLLSPSIPLLEIFRVHLPNIFARKHADAKQEKTGGSLARGMMGFAELLEKLVASLAGGSDGCVDPAPVQHLVDYAMVSLDGVSPKLEKVCVSKTWKNEYTISWRLGITPLGKLWKRAGTYDPRHDFWYIQKPKELALSSEPLDIHSMTWEREGSVKIYSSGKTTGIELSGVGINFVPPEFHLPIPGTDGNFRAPESLMRFGVGKVTADESGNFKIRISGPLFNIPLGADGKTYGKGQAGIERIRILGIPFKVEI